MHGLEGGLYWYPEPGIAYSIHVHDFEVRLQMYTIGGGWLDFKVINAGDNVTDDIFFDGAWLRFFNPGPPADIAYITLIGVKVA